MKKPTQVRTEIWIIKQGFVASIAATMSILLFFHVRTNADDMPALQVTQAQATAQAGRKTTPWNKLAERNL